MPPVSARATRIRSSCPTSGREQVRPIVWGLNVLLLLVIVANVLATTLLGVRERTRENGVLRAPSA